MRKTSETKSLRVLYVVYWGATEVTGKSWILAHVKKLAALGAELTLVTFEKPGDYARRERVEEVAAELRASGVRWIPLRYHKSPKIPGTAFDVLHAIGRGVAANLHGRFDVIHARTFLGGLVGLALAPVIGAKLIYHNEGFYPDEQVDGGVWRADSAPHRTAKFLENLLYTRADAVITMSRRGRIAVENLPAVRRKRTPVIFAPACVDLENFPRRATPLAREKDAQDVLRLVYIGSVGGRYMFDAITRFAAVAYRDAKRVHLRVLVKAEAEPVASILVANGLPVESWSIDSVSHAEVPNELARQDAGLFFLSQGLSEHGCSPTKIGEYWASGLPVITTPNAGDIDDIVRKERIGVIVPEHSDEAYSRAVCDIQSLLTDTELPERCRRAAETHYALEPAIEQQFELYRNVVG